MSTSPELQAGVTRDIYGMPAFISLDVADVRVAAQWFVGALDFIELFAMPPGDDPNLIHLRRWRYQDILLRRSTSTATSAGTGVQLSLAATFEELEPLAQRAREFGALIEGPSDTAWNTRDLGVTTPQGLRLVLTARRPEPLRDAGFNAQMDRWSREQDLHVDVRRSRGL